MIILLNKRTHHYGERTFLEHSTHHYSANPLISPAIDFTTPFIFNILASWHEFGLIETNKAPDAKY
jgi:hypothetical protein